MNKYTNPETGEFLTAKEWSKRLNITIQCFYRRAKNWPNERIYSTGENRGRPSIHEFTKNDLKKIRKEIGITCKELAKELEIEVYDYQRYENGELPLKNWIIMAVKYYKILLSVRKRNKKIKHNHA